MLRGEASFFVNQHLPCVAPHHVMINSCTWCRPRVQQLYFHQRPEGSCDGSYEPHHHACQVCNSWSPEWTTKRTQESVMETVLIRWVQNENLSNWARLILVYSTFDLFRVAIKCFQYLTNTKQQIQFGCCQSKNNQICISSSRPHSWKYWAWRTQVVCVCGVESFHH